MRLPQVDIRLLAVVASLCLSLFTFLLPVLPNNDAYVYIRTAEIYLNEGTAAAFNHYGWAGYSILIAELSRTGLSLFAAAQLLNAGLFALLVYSFIGVVSRIDGSRLTLALAALTILLYPELNEFRYFIIRDIGFWAFALFGLWQFLQYCERLDLRHIVGFTLSMLVAIVFRAEAILYLALLPLALRWQPDFNGHPRRRELPRVCAIIFGSILGISLLLLLSGINVFSLMAEFFSVYLPFLQTTFNPSEAQTTELGRLLFGDHAATFSQEYMNAVIAAGLLVILFMTIFAGLSGPFFFALLYGARKRYLRLSPATVAPVLVYILINTFVLLVFLYITRYLSSRYAIILCLMLATQIPIIVASIIRLRRDPKWERLARSLLVLFFAYCAFDSYLTFGHPRDFLTDSAAYIEQRLAPERSLLTNNHTVAYMSGRVDTYDEVARIITIDQIRELDDGDIVAVEMIYDMQQLLASEEARRLLELEAAFPANEEAKLALYRRRSRD